MTSRTSPALAAILAIVALFIFPLKANSLAVLPNEDGHTLDPVITGDLPNCTGKIIIDSPNPNNDTQDPSNPFYGLPGDIVSGTVTLIAYDETTDTAYWLGARHSTASRGNKIIFFNKAGDLFSTTIIRETISSTKDIAIMSTSGNPTLIAGDVFPCQLTDRRPMDSESNTRGEIALIAGGGTLGINQYEFGDNENGGGVRGLQIADFWNNPDSVRKPIQYGLSIVAEASTGSIWRYLEPPMLGTQQAPYENNDFTPYGNATLLGDSGGGTFIIDDGVFKLVGIHILGGTQATFHQSAVDLALFAPDEVEEGDGRNVLDWIRETLPAGILEAQTFALQNEVDNTYRQSDGFMPGFELRQRTYATYSPEIASSLRCRAMIEQIPDQDLDKNLYELLALHPNLKLFIGDIFFDNYLNDSDWAEFFNAYFRPGGPGGVEFSEEEEVIPPVEEEGAPPAHKKKKNLLKANESKLNVEILQENGKTPTFLISRGEEVEAEADTHVNPDSTKEEKVVPTHGALNSKHFKLENLLKAPVGVKKAGKIIRKTTIGGKMMMNAYVHTSAKIKSLLSKGQNVLGSKSSVAMKQSAPLPKNDIHWQPESEKPLDISANPEDKIVEAPKSKAVEKVHSKTLSTEKTDAKVSSADALLNGGRTAQARNEIERLRLLVRLNAARQDDKEEEEEISIVFKPADANCDGHENDQDWFDFVNAHGDAN